MKLRSLLMFCAALVLQAMVVNTAPVRAQETAASAAVPVRMVVTANTGSERAVEISQKDIVVKQGKEKLAVTEWTPAQGDHAGLDLFILIDDASNSSLGSHLDDVRAFINAQPATTTVGVGYMSNATVQIVQNFTTNHDAAAKSVRLPMGSVGAYGSPYLSVIDLMKRWSEHHNRREVVMITDGIDRARGGSRGRGLSINPDVDSAGDVAQRTGTIIHTIYNPGVGRAGRNFWEANSGQLGISKLSDVSGGESFYLGLQSAVSFAPYFDQLQKILGNQYWLGFSAKAGKKPSLQYVSISTTIAGVDLASADAVWVAGAK